MEAGLKASIASLSKGPRSLESVTMLRQLRPDYEQYSSEECFTMAEQLFDYWLAILCRESRLSGMAETEDADADRRWREASVYVAYHFVPALEKAEKLLLDLDARRPSDWFPFTNHGLQGMANLCTADYGFDAAVERRLLSEFLAGIWHSHFMTVVGSPVLGKTPQGWDEFVYRSFRAISEVGLASGKREHLMLASLLSRGLALRSQEAVHERDRNDFDFRNKAIGSLVVVEELSELARRSTPIIKRYGESEVEIRFEQQLSLLMQSFGFIVATTQRAQRRVDLICIASSAAPGESFTLILEAKTTAANYSLPARDARAIAEYVSSVRSVLKTFPPLRMVLVVSSNSAKTIIGKVRQLEAECGVAVRYCDVSLLQQLRRRIPGPLDFSQVLRTFVGTSGVLSWREMTQLIESDRATRVAHSEFVQTLLARNS